MHSRSPTTSTLFLLHDWVLASLRQRSCRQLCYTSVCLPIDNFCLLKPFPEAFYYTKTEYGTRIALWFGFAAVAGAFGGLLAYGIQNVKISLANWRLLFVVEVGLFFIVFDSLADVQ